MTQTDLRPRRSLLEFIFLSPDERRLRAGWRLVIQVLMQVVFLFAAGCALFAVPRSLLVAAANPNTVAGLASSEVVELASVTLSVFLARRLLDRRSFSSLGLRLSRRMFLDLAAGLGITMVMMGLIFLAEWKLGWLTITGFAWIADAPQAAVQNVLAFFIVFIAVGWNEELMSRGYHLQTIASGLTLGWGLVLSSAVFGMLHLANPHASWIGAAGIFIAGLFLGCAFVRTRQLWLSIGLHIGWNFFEGVVFGFPVSGLNVYHVTRIAVSGPDLWTGGAFGPEAGLIVVPALAVGFGLVHLYGRRYKDA